MTKAHIAAASALALTVGVSAASAADCGSLVGKTLGAATITAATNVSPPSRVLSKNPPAPVEVKAPFCRVEGAIKPTADSNILFEVWLPTEAAWNGKFEGVGNGGFAGSLDYIPMNWGLESGYAVAATDTGHSGLPRESAWALGHPEKIVDFGWRAVHETTLAAKAIVEAFYGKPPKHSYFTGCSDGGREGMMEAQRFPKDYEGIVAGAPASFWTGFMINSVSNDQALSATPDSWIPPDKLALVSKAVASACHSDNGVVDDQSQCRFDPSALLCKAGPSEDCVSQAQVSALRQIYDGVRAASGKSLSPGYAPGGEAGAGSWQFAITGAEPKRNAATLMHILSSGYYANMVYDKPDWDYHGQNLAEIYAKSEEKTGAALNATDSDLSAFRAAGGKLLQYHGWDDPAIPPGFSIEYYQQVAAKLGGAENILPFYRLFMAPGMRHCGGGPLPSAVGGIYAQPSPSHDPAHDLVAAMAHWVEDGVAPEQLIATRYRDNDPAKGVVAQRPWCLYPSVAQYSGQGDRADAASYKCVAASK